MSYLDPDTITALINAVEQHGGAKLPDKCDGTTITYDPPPGTEEKPQKTKTCRCGNDLIFVIPYEPHGTQKQRKRARDNGAGFVRACASCDSIDKWPYFEQAVATAGEE